MGVSWGEVNRQERGTRENDGWMSWTVNSLLWCSMLAILVCMGREEIGSR